MIFTETALEGAFIVDIQPHEDDRGFFARAFCQREFEEHGLNPVVAQSNVAFNPKRGTVRGMHFQYPPAAETKLVQCTRGAILDVVLDLRPESTTFLQHVAVRLDEENLRALYVPARCAHGYQTLVDRTAMQYHVSEFYAPGHEGGLGFDDPRLGLEWPLPVSMVSEKDRSWPLLDEIAESLRSKMATTG